MIQTYFAEYDDSGIVPPLEGVDFLLLAQPSRARWGIFAVYEWLDPVPAGLTALPREVTNLAYSGEGYSPALAIARHEVAREPTTIARGEFAAKYAAAIKKQLDSQATAPYLLAEALKDQPGYMQRGAYYWIVDYDLSNRVGPVQWVSRDYFVYSDAASAFRIELQTLVNLSQRTGSVRRMPHGDR